MTVFELEDALVEFVGQNTYEYRFRSNEQTDEMVAPRVYTGFIPRDEVGSIIPGEITVYPAIIINARRGTQTEESEIVTVEIMVGAFDDTLDQQGYRDITNLIQRLKDRFREIDIIRERFPVRMPLKWEINRKLGAGGLDNSYPYFFGEMQINFELPVMITQYDATPGMGETDPGRYNEVPIPTPYEQPA
jgi:hypothetical protein